MAEHHNQSIYSANHQHSNSNGIAKPTISSVPLAERYLAAIQSPRQSNDTDRPHNEKNSFGDTDQSNYVNDAIASSNQNIHTTHHEDSTNNYNPQYQLQPKSVGESNMQSRNGSTSPSRGRLIRSESYQTRDSANSSIGHDSLSSTTSKQDDPDTDDYGTLSQSNTTYRRQWTPNQWRNYRMKQEMEQMDQTTSQGNIIKEDHRSNNELDSVVGSDTSLTKTDVVTNKSFDMRRRNWLNHGANKLKDDVMQQQQQQQNHHQKNNSAGESDFLESTDVSEKKKPLHQDVSQNTNQKKWQSKVSSDRAWIKSHYSDQKESTRDFNEKDESEIELHSSTARNEQPSWLKTTDKSGSIGKESTSMNQRGVNNLTPLKESGRIKVNDDHSLSSDKKPVKKITSSWLNRVNSTSSSNQKLPKNDCASSIYSQNNDKDQSVNEPPQTKQSYKSSPSRSLNQTSAPSESSINRHTWGDVKLKRVKDIKHEEHENTLVEKFATDCNDRIQVESCKDTKRVHSTEPRVSVSERVRKFTNCEDVEKTSTSSKVNLDSHLYDQATQKDASVTHIQKKSIPSTVPRQDSISVENDLIDSGKLVNPATATSMETHNQSEFVSVRARLRNWNDKNEKTTKVLPYQSLRSSPTRSLIIERQEENDIGSIEANVNNGKRNVLRSGSNTPPPLSKSTNFTFNRKNKLGSFLNVPHHGDVSPDQSSSLKNLGPSPSSSVRRNRLETSYQSNSSRNQSGQEVGLFNEESKKSSGLPKLPSIQQRIRSLNGDINSKMNLNASSTNVSMEQSEAASPSLPFNGRHSVPLSECRSAHVLPENESDSTSAVNDKMATAVDVDSGKKGCERGVESLKSIFESKTSPSPVYHLKTKMETKYVGDRSPVTSSSPKTKEKDFLNDQPLSCEPVNTRLMVNKKTSCDDPNLEKIAKMRVSESKHDAIHSSNQKSAFTSIRSKFENYESSPRQIRYEKHDVITNTATVPVESKVTHLMPNQDNAIKFSHAFRSIEMIKNDDSCAETKSQNHSVDNHEFIQTDYSHSQFKSNDESAANDIPWRGNEYNHVSSSSLKHVTSTSVHQSKPGIYRHDYYDENITSQTRDVAREGYMSNDNQADASHHKVHIDINEDVINASNDSYNDDEDCDGVTLSPTTSDVSSLSIPTCIQSVESSDESSSASSSDEDTGAMESGTDKLSSVRGASEASSSHASEAATPLINSTLRKMSLQRLTSNSDSTQSIDAKQVVGLLGSIPTLKEDNSLDSKIDDEDFLPEWEASFTMNNSDDDSSESDHWESFEAYNESFNSSSSKAIQIGGKSSLRLDSWSVRRSINTLSNKVELEGSKGNTNHSMKSNLSDLENQSPTVIQKQILRTSSSSKHGSTSRRFDREKVKAYQLARRKSFERMKQNVSR